MEQNIEALVCILNEIRDVYGRMTGLSEKKKDYIICGDAQAVGKVAQEEWTLFEKIVGLEERRVAVVGDVCEQWGIHGKEATLAEIEKRVDEDARKTIAQAGEELKKVVFAQRAINDQNMALLNLHFEYMYFMMENFMGAEAGSNIYGNSGAIQAMGARNVAIIDSHV